MTGVVDFFSQILNSARNWRDHLQSELPAYRDRICQIRLKDNQGGLNLNMPPPVIDQLVALGTSAGDAICVTPGFNWDKHRCVRFRTLMQSLQDGFIPSGRAFAEFSAQPAACADADPAWWASARAAATGLFNVNWGPNGSIDFDLGAPVPEAEARITPKT